MLGGYFIKTRIDDMGAALVERGRAIANQLAPASGYGVLADNHAILQALAEATLSEADVVRVTILDNNRHTLTQAHTGDNRALDLRNLLEFETPILGGGLAIGDFARGRNDIRDGRAIEPLLVCQYPILPTSSESLRISKRLHTSAW